MKTIVYQFVSIAAQEHNALARVDLYEEGSLHSSSPQIQLLIPLHGQQIHLQQLCDQVKQAIPPAQARQMLEALATLSQPVPQP